MRNFTYPGKENCVVTSIVWDLYQNGEITFDEVMDPVYSELALCQISSVLTVRELLLAPFEESFSYISILWEEQDRRGLQRTDVKRFLKPEAKPH